MRFAFSKARILAAAALLAQAPGAGALDFSFSDLFHNDNEVAYFKLVADGSGPLTLRTDSYQAGGFDPVLTLYDNSGHLSSAGLGYILADDIDYGAGELDAEFTGTLTAGTYWLALTQSTNFGDPYIGDGFAWDDWTSDLSSFTSGCVATEADSTGMPFTQNDCSTRTGDWSLVILGLSAATMATASEITANFPPTQPPSPPPFPVPEPGSLALLGLGLATLVGRRPPLARSPDRGL